MAADGYFHPDSRVELIDGTIYDQVPQSSRHSTGVALLGDALRPAFSTDAVVRVRGPLALGDDSEPEPDIAVVPGGFRDYVNSHPSAALLVVEVSSDQSLLYDRRIKLPLYARYEIPECWVLNLREEALEVYREPSGGLYRSRVSLIEGDTVSPLTRPDAVIEVAELIP